MQQLQDLNEVGSDQEGKATKMSKESLASLEKKHC
jgi:hypothetical protein